MAKYSENLIIENNILEAKIIKLIAENTKLKEQMQLNGSWVSNDEIKEQAYRSLERTEHYNEFEKQGYYRGYKAACYWMRKKLINNKYK